MEYESTKKEVSKWIPILKRRVKEDKSDDFYHAMISLGILVLKNGIVEVNRKIKENSLLMTWDALYQVCEEKIWAEYPKSQTINRIFPLAITR